MPIEYNLKNFKVKDPDIKKIKEIFNDLEFKRMTENFMKIFSNKKNSIELPDSPKEIQYDLFNAPGLLSSQLKSDVTSSVNNVHFYQKINTDLGGNLLFEKISKQKKIGMSLVNSINETILGI